MRHLGKSFLRGLAAVLPVAVTLYLVYVLAVGAERLIGGMLKLVVPAGVYWPGMGLALALVAITAIGVVVRLPWMALLMRLADAVMRRIPLVKVVYSTVRDFTDFVTRMREHGDVGRPVRVRLWGEVEAIGLITDSEPRLGPADGAGERALVYLPMSYQIGGYTLSLPKDRLEPLEMSMEEALRYVVTAGIQKGKGPDRKDG
ncbi:MAG TPA: DUF502 domain-containing protein [Gammaproteobacteria bacterium]|nr:DUF502 domain-containing protein [Gammaproteobacteria bacterium]